jgi:hypothetical protein
VISGRVFWSLLRFVGQFVIFGLQQFSVNFEQLVVIVDMKLDKIRIKE